MVHYECYFLKGRISLTGGTRITPAQTLFTEVGWGPDICLGPGI